LFLVEIHFSTWYLILTLNLKLSTFGSTWSNPINKVYQLISGKLNRGRDYVVIPIMMSCKHGICHWSQHNSKTVPIFVSKPRKASHWQWSHYISWTKRSLRSVQTVEAVVGLLTVRQLYLISKELTHRWRITEMGWKATHFDLLQPKQPLNK